MKLKILPHEVNCLQIIDGMLYIADRPVIILGDKNLYSITGEFITFVDRDSFKTTIMHATDVTYIYL